MNSRATNRISVPARLLDKLSGFRRALIRQVLRDACWAVFLVVLMLFSLLLIADRFGDTSASIRLLLLVILVGALGVAMVRVWQSIWICRSPLRVAQVIRRRDPVFGDHLVGAIELAASESELARSETLCVAALQQVSDEAESRDFDVALPDSRFQILAAVSLGLLSLIVALGVFAPGMTLNTALRLFIPGSETPRYTFARVRDFPETVVVPRDEASQWRVSLGPSGRWEPRHAALTIGSRRFTAMLQTDGGAANSVAIGAPEARPMQYCFDIPRLFEPTWADLRVGDWLGRVRLMPKLRPELTSVAAKIGLPDYLAERVSDDFTQADFSGGVVNTVEGATVTLRLTVSSPLREAMIDGQRVAVNGRTFSALVNAAQQSVQVNWIDHDGLHAAESTTVTVNRFPDERPTLLVENQEIPERVLDSQSLKFSLTARDDFAVRRVGLQWNAEAESGERVLGANEGQATISAVFQATALSVPPGSVNLRFWVEDDFPGRDRVYSDAIEIDVLTPDEHAVWIADQFARWRQSAMDVRDRELNLFSRNRELAETSAENRNEDWRTAVAQQSRAEEFNGRQLQTITAEGEQLLRQAARNQEVDVAYVEKLASTIKTLEEMAQQRMPRVAELLNQAAEAEREESKFAELLDQESSQGDLPDPIAGNSEDQTQSKQEGEVTEKIGLAGTTIVDTSKRTKTDQDSEEAESDSLTIALEDQADLVGQFDAVAEELKELLGSMEGSTLVKRLKSVSRLQDRAAMQLAREIELTFGQSPDQNTAIVQSVVADVAESANRVRTVLDDLEAFCRRREIEHFTSVLAEMKTARVLEQLQRLQAHVAERPGVSIAVAEYWADNLDRWADDLVDPGSDQPESGPQNNQSLSPAVVIEVLRILEAEVNLREQTRVAEQGRQTMADDDYRSEAIRLSESQDILRDRLDVVVHGIESLPNSMVNFADDIEVLGLASSAMVDAAKTLISPETGPVAIAAQTEAIELLLRSSKVSPEGGGGSGGSAGGGNGGETDQAAAVLLGRGLNELAISRELDTQLSVGRDSGEVPEQWRAGLNEYFNRLERRRSAPATGAMQ